MVQSEILRLLEETGDYVSGNMLAEHFSVSRTAVWKAIGQLKAQGYEIDAVRNRGYILKGNSKQLTEAGISGHIKAWAGQNLVLFHETDSTNSSAKKAGEGGACHGTLVIAEKQTGGRGRRGRVWESPEGSGIWMSLLLRPQINPEKASMFTLLAALAVRRAVSDAVGLNLKIKWPNDLVSGGKKICGILTEMSAEMDCIHYVVIGIGMNVNTESFSDEIRDKASSIYLETGRKMDRNFLAAEIMNQFAEYYDRFVKEGDLGSFLKEYEQFLINCGQMVRIELPGYSYTAEALGIDRQGHLIVKTKEGEMRNITSGEVSVRGVYGYV